MQSATQERRRFFRRAGLITLIGAAGAGAGWKAWAHGGWRRGELLSEAHVERMLQHFYIEIEATEAQKQRLAPIVKDAVKELVPLRAKLHAARAQALDLLTREPVDPAALEALRAEQVALADDASRRFSRALSEAAQVLTQAQRKELAERLERRHRHRWS